MNTESRTTALKRKPARISELRNRRALADPFRKKTPTVAFDTFAEPERAGKRRGAVHACAFGLLVVASLAFAGTLTACVLVPAGTTISAATDSAWSGDGP